VKSRKALFNEADAMLSRARDKNERHTVLNRIVKHFIALGNNDYAWRYYLKTKDQHDKFIILQCYALESMIAGNEKDLRDLLEQDISWPERDLILSEMIFFYASKDNMLAADEIFQKGETANEDSSMIKSMIFGLVKNNHFGSLKKVIDAIKNDVVPIYTHFVVAICAYAKLNDMNKFLFVLADRNDECTFLKLLANKFIADDNSKELFKLLNSFYRRPFGLKLSQLIMYDLAYFARMKDLAQLINTAPETIRKDLYPSMAKGFVNGNKMDEAIIIYKSMEIPDEALLIACCLVDWISKEGNWHSLLRVCAVAKNHLDNLYPYIDTTIFMLGAFSTVDYAIDTLSRINDPELRKNMTLKLAACKGTPEIPLLYKVDKLNLLMTCDNIPSKIGIEWVKLTLVTQIFLLSFHLFQNKKLKAGIALRIASYLSPMPEGIKARDLANFLNDHYYKNRINNRFSTKHTLFFEKSLPFREFKHEVHQAVLKM
jgi:hypothetical protein